MSDKKLVYGVGINDVDEPTSYKVFPEERIASGGYKYIGCPYYQRWTSMLQRCYSGSLHKRSPTYKDCTVCEEWLTFSNFKSWMVDQDWESNALDKDLLVGGNGVYSPRTCVFIGHDINTFIMVNKTSRGEHLIGCYWDKYTGNFKSAISNPFNSKGTTLGRYSTEIEAHLAWKKQKHIYACELADSEYVTDERVAEALRNKYKNYTIYEEEL